jgi:hypothetical protein
MTYEYNVGVDYGHGTEWFRGYVTAATITDAMNEAVGRFVTEPVVAVEVEVADA